ncbi:MAG: RNA polymerase sigma factor [Eubacteriales bacterium]
MFCHELNDESLVLLTLAGERYAYEMLVTRWQKAVIASAMSVLHSRYMAEDAAQDAFITAWMKLDCLREPDKFGAWVCRIACNCAKNTIRQYRSWLPAEMTDTEYAYEISQTPDNNPESAYLISEEYSTVKKSIGRLPRRVSEIIRLHYFEDMPVGEIARRLGITEGTVKSQLHDGRKRIRKDLCAMNEQYNDNLTQRVMKKVEELRNWQFRNSKKGFEDVYRDVLAEVEALPESNEQQETGKYRAMADVLVRGWWWIAESENPRSTERLDRIRETAERGHNDAVMAFLCEEEIRKLWGDARTEYIRNTLIPRYEAGNYPLALTNAWYLLGIYLMTDENRQDAARREEADRAFQTALSVSGSGMNPYAAAAQAALARNQLFYDAYKDKPEHAYRLRAGSEEYRLSGGIYRRFDRDWYGCGALCATDLETEFVLYNASLCDGYFTYPGLSVGECHIGSDGTCLKYAAAHETVTVPAGTFEDCQVWEVLCRGSKAGRYISWYRENVGIVRQEYHCDSITETRVLAACSVSGRGLLPLHHGSTWEYIAEPENAFLKTSSRYTVFASDEDTVIVSVNTAAERIGYNENSWLDMIDQIRNEYFDGERVCDVSHAIARAEALAKTPLEKAHTAAAASAAKRIMETDPVFNPDCRATGHWNFFSRNTVTQSDDRTKYMLHDNFRWSFELKNTGADEEPLLYNDILDILCDACGCISHTDWKPGYRDTLHLTTKYHTPLCTEITCEDAGEMTVQAGTFSGCMRMTLQISGYHDGLAYRGGKKIYFFAPGIGIIRTENEYCEGARTAVYELASYKGTGTGWQPMEDGMVRTYEAKDLTDGYIAGAVYTYVYDAAVSADDGSCMVIFSDRTGIREKPQRITDYASVDGEAVEERLWEEGKHEESRLRHAVNNFRLFAHFHGRPSRYWAAPDKAAAWNRYRMQLIEGLNGDGSIPDAWLGHYAAACFRLSCALFGCGRKDEGYEALDRAFPYMEKWLSVPDGTDMETGNPLIWGGLRVRKGKKLLILPNGTCEPLYYGYLFDTGASLMYYGLTAPHGWEWFDGVRNEERYQAAVERAWQLYSIHTT